MIEDEEAHTSIQRHEWEQSHKVVIHNATILVGKCPKGKDVGNGFICVFVEYYVGSRWLDSSCCTFLSSPALLDATEIDGWKSLIGAASITCTRALAIIWTGVIAILGIVL
jgi:hypothetical protein